MVRSASHSELRCVWSLRCMNIPFIHRSDNTSELQCVNHRSPMVANVSLFEVADAPTNWYVSSIPKKWRIGNFKGRSHQHFFLRISNLHFFFTFPATDLKQNRLKIFSAVLNGKRNQRFEYKLWNFNDFEKYPTRKMAQKGLIRWLQSYIAFI